MIEYAIWCRIEPRESGRYVVRVSSIPHGVPERCAPEERCGECCGYVEARTTAIDLGRALAQDVRARGHRVMRPQGGPACAFSGPVPRNERRALARTPEEA